MNARTHRLRGNAAALAIVSMCLALLVMPARSTESDPVAHEPPTTRIIVEEAPSLETVRRLDDIFERAGSLTVFYTAESEMGRVGYNQKMARELARFQLSVSCRGSCKVEFAQLRDDLAKGLRIRGTCPGSINAAIDFTDQAGKAIASIIATAEGQCFTLDAQSYFLKELSLRNRLEALSSVMR
jgi:hypothetical protein